MPAKHAIKISMPVRRASICAHPRRAEENNLRQAPPLASFSYSDPDRQKTAEIQQVRILTKAGLPKAGFGGKQDLQQRRTGAPRLGGAWCLPTIFVAFINDNC